MDPAEPGQRPDPFLTARPGPTARELLSEPPLGDDRPVLARLEAEEADSRSWVDGTRFALQTLCLFTILPAMGLILLSQDAVGRAFGWLILAGFVVTVATLVVVRTRGLRREDPSGLDEEPEFGDRTKFGPLQ